MTDELIKHTVDYYKQCEICKVYIDDFVVRNKRIYCHDCVDSAHKTNSLT